MTFEQMFEDNVGRAPKTTLWEDFAIADRFGLSAIKSTYTKAKRFCSKDPELWGEFSIVLNWRCSMHYGAGREGLARVYDELSYQSRDDFYTKVADEKARSVYFQLTD